MKRSFHPLSSPSQEEQSNACRIAWNWNGHVVVVVVELDIAIVPTYQSLLKLIRWPKVELEVPVIYESDRSSSSRPFIWSSRWPLTITRRGDINHDTTCSDSDDGVMADAEGRRRALFGRDDRAICHWRLSWLLLETGWLCCPIELLRDARRRWLRRDRDWARVGRMILKLDVEWCVNSERFELFDAWRPASKVKILFSFWCQRGSDFTEPELE